MNSQKSICLFFQVHQPIKLRKYHFFDIGKSNSYFDEFSNRTAIQRVARNCYTPMNTMLLELAERFGDKFKISLAISGVTLELLQAYAPEVITSFAELAATGSVEFVSSTYSHSLSSLYNEKVFTSQIKHHKAEMERLFDVPITSFCNTEMIYSNTIGEMISKLGFRTVLTEGARHILGWKSPNYLYASSETPKLKILMRNPQLSNALSQQLQANSSDEYIKLLRSDSQENDLINLFMEYEAFGEDNSHESGNSNLLRETIEGVIASDDLTLLTVSEASAKHQPKATVNIPHAISWLDEERDTSAWLGNELQNDAFESMNKLYKEINKLDNDSLSTDYLRLLSSDNIQYMSTKQGASSGHRNNPYDSPYEAFINYMNIVSDVAERVKSIKTLKASKKKTKKDKSVGYETK